MDFWPHGGARGKLKGTKVNTIHPEEDMKVLVNGLLLLKSTVDHVFE